MRVNPTPSLNHDALPGTPIFLSNRGGLGNTSEDVGAGGGRIGWEVTDLLRRGVFEKVHRVQQQQTGLCTEVKSVLTHSPEHQAGTNIRHLFLFSPVSFFQSTSPATFSHLFFFLTFHSVSGPNRFTRLKKNKNKTSHFKTTDDLISQPLWFKELQ